MNFLHPVSSRLDEHFELSRIFLCSICLQKFKSYLKLIWLHIKSEQKTKNWIISSWRQKCCGNKNFVDFLRCLATVSSYLSLRITYVAFPQYCEDRPDMKMSGGKDRRNYPQIAQKTATRTWNKTPNKRQLKYLNNYVNDHLIVIILLCSI